MDITICTNNDCPQAYNCWRYGCPPDKFNKYYQKFTPQQYDDKDFKCKMFIEYPNRNNKD